MKLGDEGFMVNGVILPVAEMTEEEIGLMENAGFLRAEWDGHHWLFPTAASLNEATGGDVHFENAVHPPESAKQEER